MFSDCKSSGFGIEQTQIHYPDRVARLILVIALALYWAVSMAKHPSPAEKAAHHQPRKVAKSKLSWFTRGLRKLMKRLLKALPLPKLWGSQKTDGW